MWFGYNFLIYFCHFFHFNRHFLTSDFMKVYRLWVPFECSFSCIIWEYACAFDEIPIFISSTWNKLYFLGGVVGDGEAGQLYQLHCLIYICIDIGFLSITFTGMHWFHWKFAEGYLIVKYRSSSILVIIHKVLAKLWPFFNLVFVVRVKYKVKILFSLSNFWRDALISLEVYRMVYHYSIEVKFEFGNHPKTFGPIIAL